MNYIALYGETLHFNDYNKLQKNTIDYNRLNNRPLLFTTFPQHYSWLHYNYLHQYAIAVNYTPLLNYTTLGNEFFCHQKISVLPNGNLFCFKKCS